MLTSSTWTITADYQNKQAANVFASLEQVFKLQGKTINHGRMNNVCRVEVDGVNYFVKRYVKAGKRLRRYIGKSRVNNEWENLLFFHKLGIPSANVVAYGEDKKYGGMVRGALVTEEVQNTKDLRQMVIEKSPLLKNREWVTQVIHQVASVARILHNNRFIHTDFKWRNILVTQEDKPRIALIDCPSGSVVPRPLVERGVVKDLACLDKIARIILSRNQRITFYTLYTGRSLNSSDKKRISNIVHFFSDRD